MTGRRLDIDCTIEGLWQEFSARLKLRGIAVQEPLSPDDLRRLRLIFFMGSATMFELIGAVLSDADVTADDIDAFRFRISTELRTFTEQGSELH